MNTVVVAKAVVVDSDDFILTLRRSNTHPVQPLKADLPGGEVEMGEEPGHAVLRELEEETGLKVESANARLIFSGTTLQDNSIVRLLYLIKLKTKQPPIRLSFEHDAYAWKPLTQLAEIEKEYSDFYARGLRYIEENDIVKSLDLT